MLDGLLILLGFQFLGETLVHLLGIPFPGPVAGMLLLLAALLTRQTWVERVAPAANMLIRHLTLLIFPIGVGIALEWSRYSPYTLALVVAVIGGTIVTLFLVALTLKWLLGGEGS